MIDTVFFFESQVEKSQALEFILHVADISNPAKDWDLHRQWTTRIMEEFFCQVSKQSMLEVTKVLGVRGDRSKLYFSLVSGDRRSKRA